MTFITEFKIAETQPAGDGQLGITRVFGRIKFDGRLRKDQLATFVAFTGRSDYEDKASFKVIVEKKSGTVRREMKACPQKDAIQAEILNHVYRENLREAIREDEAAEQEYGVDRERQLAAAHSRSNAIIATAITQDAELNEMVAAAAVKDSDDKLEIPSFLKR